MTLALATLARSLRNFAYGGFAVVFAIALTQRGFSIGFVALLVTACMVTGALFSLLTGPLERRIGATGALVLGSLLMAAAGVLAALARRPELLLVATLFGTLSPGGQEVGPFAALEQTAISRAGSDRGSTRRFAIYNFAGTFAGALGALASGLLGGASTMWLYAAVGALLALLYPFLRLGGEARLNTMPRARKWGRPESLAALFGFDALAGGFVVQTFLAYYFQQRFALDQRVLGELFFGANALAALSFFAAAPIAERFGNLRTMVFSHLPSNVLLLIVPLMPTFPAAAAVLMARFALSQMDVPTRQAFAMAAVPDEDRARTAGLTNAVRPAAAAIAPLLSGIAFSNGVLALPFFVAGTMKIVYDLAIFAAFRRVEAESGKEIEPA